MAYTIKKTEPYVIHGEKGDYLIPALKTLSIDKVSDIMSLTTDTPVEKRVEAVKAFLLRMAPELEAEEIGDVEFSMIFADYEKEQGLGK